MLDDGTGCGVPHIGCRGGAPEAQGLSQRLARCGTPTPQDYWVPRRANPDLASPAREPRKLPGASRRSIPPHGEKEKGKAAPDVSKQPAGGALAKHRDKGMVSGTKTE